MLDWEQAFRMTVHIARALEVAHQHEIVHRNVTPENILLGRAQPIAKLGDLMLARAIEETVSNQITRDGELLGEVAYMSPERTRGEPIDHRSDLYGLGATLYAVLAGQPPFQSASIPSLVSMIQQDEPLPPKTFQLSINEAFQNVVMKLLEKNPADRFESPSQLLKELERIGKFAGIEVP
jgi:serine/threonine protein kinase